MTFFRSHLCSRSSIYLPPSPAPPSVTRVCGQAPVGCFSGRQQWVLTQAYTRPTTQVSLSRQECTPICLAFYCCCLMTFACALPAVHFSACVHARPSPSLPNSVPLAISSPFSPSLQHNGLFGRALTQSSSLTHPGGEGEQWQGGAGSGRNQVPHGINEPMVIDRHCAKGSPLTGKLSGPAFCKAVLICLDDFGMGTGYLVPDAWRPDSFYARIQTNQRGGMHTLCLLGLCWCRYEEGRDGEGRGGVKGG